MIEFEARRIQIYSDQIDRIYELELVLKQLPLRKRESGIIFKKIGQIFARISVKKIELGYFGFDGWETCTDRKGFSDLPPVLFTTYFPYQLGPHSSYDDKGKAKIISLVRKKDKELLVWKKITGESG